MPCAFATITEKTISAKRLISEEEYNTIKGHLDRVSEWESDNRRIEIVTNAYENVMTGFDGISGGGISSKAAEDLSFSLTYYLSACKKYLDNWETYLKRRYGKGSGEFRLFKQAQGYEYDHKMEYRILYRLRNYDQHCGDLVSCITDKASPGGERQCTVCVSRERLLRDFDGWRDEEAAYLRSREESFDIKPLIEAFQTCILTIHSKMMQHRLNMELCHSCAALLEAVKDIEDEEDLFLADLEDMGEEHGVQRVNVAVSPVKIPVYRYLLICCFLCSRDEITVVYHGASLKQQIGPFAYEVDLATAERIIGSQERTIDFCGQKMLRLYEKVFFDHAQMCIMLVKAGYPLPKIDQLRDEWRYLLEAMIKL